MLCGGKQKGVNTVMFGLSIPNSSSNSATAERSNKLNSSKSAVAFPLRDTVVSSREQDDLEYGVDDEQLSYATHVIFPAAPHENICLKLWVHGDDELYNLRNNAICNGYLLEGLDFNRQFAEGVHVGIVQVIEQEKEKLLCGPVIEHPVIDQLDINKPYALMMRRLPASARLDHRLSRLGACGGVDFLARSIAAMHEQLYPSSQADKSLKYIPEKLALNTKLFERALNRLVQEEFNIEPYRRINDLMIEAQKNLDWLFERRVEGGFIKRCHGDLKTANLWLEPHDTSSPNQSSHRLLALDCVDFNPKFCHIDILSDISMLAVDLEMRLPRFLRTTGANKYSRSRDKSFLGMYLQYLKERHLQVESPWYTWPLLEYYMTEKAMVRSYMSILYDGLPTLGKKYLRVALNHAKGLEEWLSYPLFQTSSELPLCQASMRGLPWYLSTAYHKFVPGFEALNRL